MSKSLRMQKLNPNSLNTPFNLLLCKELNYIYITWMGVAVNYNEHHVRGRKGSTYILQRPRPSRETDAQQDYTCYS